MHKKIINAAEKGGKVLADLFGTHMKIEEKLTVADLRTDADVESEKAILNVLERDFPEYNIRSEESGTKDKGSDYTFVVDPLDGSNNFVLGIPNFSVTIALLKGDTVVSAVIHDPILKHTYHAEKGKGAWQDETRIHVNDENDIHRASVAYTCGYKGHEEFTKRIIVGLYNKKIKRTLMNWSPALDYCLLASGKIEAMIAIGKEPHDCLVGKLVIKEAGGMITDFEGNEEKSDDNETFIASNGTAIHEEVRSIV